MNKISYLRQASIFDYNREKYVADKYVSIDKCVAKV